MAIQIQGNGGTVGEVESSFRAMRIAHRPLDPTTLGAYRIAASSGQLTGTAIVAGAPLFSARWSDATRFAVITRLKAYMVFTTIITAAQEMGLDMMIARSFSVSDSSGTSILPATNTGKMRTSMGTTLFGDMRIANTSLLTAGTRTLDGQAIQMATGWNQDVNVAAGTQKLIYSQGVLDFSADMQRGEHPIILAQNEGVLVRNLIVPATASGAWKLIVEMAWTEVSSF